MFNLILFETEPKLLQPVQPRKGGRWVLIVELEELRDKEEVLRKGEKIGKLWRMRIDEDMSMEEKRRRWRMMEAARRERARVKRMELSNRELWVEGRRWL